jgi:hypothetical protein
MSVNWLVFVFIIVRYYPYAGQTSIGKLCFYMWYFDSESILFIYILHSDWFSWIKNILLYILIQYDCVNSEYYNAKVVDNTNR